jgi:hypothetical protein
MSANLTRSVRLDDAGLYADLCDLFDQAIFMGRHKSFDDDVDTSPDRIRSTSPQARRFANAAFDRIDNGHQPNRALQELFKRHQAEREN